MIYLGRVLGLLALLEELLWFRHDIGSDSEVMIKCLVLLLPGEAFGDVGTENEERQRDFRLIFDLLIKLL